MSCMYDTLTNVYIMKVEVKLLREMKGTNWEGRKKSTGLMKGYAQHSHILHRDIIHVYIYMYMYVWMLFK